MKASGKFGRDILHAVHCQIDLPLQQLLFDLLDKEPLSPDLRQRDIQNLVPRRMNDFKIDPEPGMILFDA
jgi:hypothetical protein